MKINVTIGVQFMQKDRESDMPKMHPMEKYQMPMEVDIPYELAPYVEEYVKSSVDDSYSPTYNAPAYLVKELKKRVKKAYPELMEQKPSNDGIIEAALNIAIDDVIDDRIDDDKEAVLERLHIKKPADTDQLYLANVFVRKFGWAVVE